MKNLTESNFETFALENYKIKCTTLEDFREDLSRIKLIKRLFKKYEQTDTIEPKQVRLLLNHFQILFNVFNEDAVIKLLFLKTTKDLHKYIKTFLLFKGILPEVIEGINGKTIKTYRISKDKEILKCLEQL